MYADKHLKEELIIGDYGIGHNSTVYLVNRQVAAFHIFVTLPTTQTVTLQVFPKSTIEKVKLRMQV